MLRRIIDVHTHIGVSTALKVEGNAEKVIKLMDENGIDMGIISPIPGFKDPNGIQDVKKQNDNIASIIKQYPERFPVGMGIVEPRHGEGKQNLDEIDRIFSDLKLGGLMFHNDFSGIMLNDKVMFSFLERALKYKEQNIVIMVHTCHFSHLESPNRLANLAEAFPELVFINLHPAMNETQLSHSIYVAQKCPNIYLDTCFLHHLLWPVEKLVKELGAERIMFGSDLPYYTRCIDKVIVESANISDKEKEQIFYKTANELFQLSK